MVATSGLFFGVHAVVAATRAPARALHAPLPWPPVTGPLAPALARPKKINWAGSDAPRPRPLCAQTNTY